jgi:hypothetical protein
VGTARNASAFTFPNTVSVGNVLPGGVELKHNGAVVWYELLPKKGAHQQILLGIGACDDDRKIKHEKQLRATALFVGEN